MGIHLERPLLQQIFGMFLRMRKMQNCKSAFPEFTKSQQSASVELQIVTSLCTVTHSVSALLVLLLLLLQNRIKTSPEPSPNRPEPSPSTLFQHPRRHLPSVAVPPGHACHLLRLVVAVLDFAAGLFPGDQALVIDVPAKMRSTICSTSLSFSSCLSRLIFSALTSDSDSNSSVTKPRMSS